MHLPRTRRGRALTGLGVVCIGLTLTAGSCDEKGLGDAPVGVQHEAPRQVWVNADTFPNITAFCVGHNGVYTTTRNAPPVVVVSDPECGEGGLLVGG